MRRAAGRAWWAVLFLLVVWAPLPIGSVNTEWSMVLAAACLVLGAVGIVFPRGRAGFTAVLLPVFGLVVLGAVQLLPWPCWFTALVSPERLRLPRPPGGEGVPGLSVYPGATLEQVVLLLGFALLLAALARRRSRMSFRLLALAGVVHAVLAFVLSAVGATGSAGGETRVFGLYRYGEVLTPFGTYVNKNHFAGLMLICLGAMLALLLRRRVVILRGQDARLDFWERLGEFTRGTRAVRIILPAVGVLLLATAVFASGSRGAALALVAALGGTAVVLGIRARRVRLRWVAGVAVLLLVAALAGTLGRSTSVLERILPSGRYLNRPRLWANVLSMAGRYPALGTGLGTFPYVFPRYQEFEPSRRFTHAESDWFQQLAEGGAVGFLLWVLFAFLLARKLWKLAGGSPGRRGLAVGGAVGLAAIGVHGLVDVSLHIPANLLAATVLAGGLLGQAAGAGRESATDSGDSEAGETT